MSAISPAIPAAPGAHDRVCKTLMAPAALPHLRRVLEEGRIVIRFENGYGVTVCQTALEGQEEVLEMLLLRFYGPGGEEYQLAQYVPLPELSRGNFDEFLLFCQQVALLPPSRPEQVLRPPEAMLRSEDS